MIDHTSEIADDTTTSDQVSTRLINIQWIPNRPVTSHIANMAAPTAAGSHRSRQRKLTVRIMLACIHKVNGIDTTKSNR